VAGGVPESGRVPLFLIISILPVQPWKPVIKVVQGEDRSNLWGFQDRRPSWFPTQRIFPSMEKNQIQSAKEKIYF